MSRPGERISFRFFNLDGRRIVESKNTPILKKGILQLKAKNTYSGETHGLGRTDSGSSCPSVHNAKLAGPLTRKCLPSG